MRAHDRPGQGGSKIRLANLAYNMRRFVWLGVRSAPALKEMDDGDGRRSLRVGLEMILFAVKTLR